MSEVCPKSGQPCPLDRQLAKLADAVPDQDKKLVAALTSLVLELRSSTGCDGEFLEEETTDSSLLCMSAKHSDFVELAAITSRAREWPENSWLLTVDS